MDRARVALAPVDRRATPGDGQDDLALVLARLMFRVERASDDRTGAGTLAWATSRERFLARSRKLLRACEKEGLVVMRLASGLHGLE